MRSPARPAPAKRIDPALESYRFNEAWRRDSIARQLDLNYRTVWMAGYGPRYPNPFEPWPRVPGDIWGYPQPQPIEQPIGDETIQIGPDRWLYRPVYARQIVPARAVSAVPTASKDAGKASTGRGAAVASQPRPAPSDAEPIEKPAPRDSGRRAF